MTSPHDGPAPSRPLVPGLAVPTPYRLPAHLSVADLFEVSLGHQLLSPVGHGRLATNGNC